jgi:hypothetical protein
VKWWHSTSCCCGGDGGSNNSSRNESLGTKASNGPTALALVMLEYGALVRWELTGKKAKHLGRNHHSTFCPAWTIQVSVVRSQQQTAWSPHSTGWTSDIQHSWDQTISQIMDGQYITVPKHLNKPYLRIHNKESTKKNADFLSLLYLNITCGSLWSFILQNYWECIPSIMTEGNQCISLHKTDKYFQSKKDHLKSSPSGV